MVAVLLQLLAVCHAIRRTEKKYLNIQDGFHYDVCLEVTKNTHLSIKVMLTSLLQKTASSGLMFLQLAATQAKLPVFGFVWWLFQWILVFFSPRQYKMPCQCKDGRCSSTRFGIGDRTVKFCVPAVSFFTMVHSGLLLDSGSEQSWRSYFSVTGFVCHVWKKQCCSVSQQRALIILFFTESRSRVKVMDHLAS